MGGRGEQVHEIVEADRGRADGQASRDGEHESGDARTGRCPGDQSPDQGGERDPGQQPVADQLDAADRTGVGAEAAAAQPMATTQRGHGDRAEHRQRRHGQQIPGRDGDRRGQRRRGQRLEADHGHRGRAVEPACQRRGRVERHHERAERGRPGLADHGDQEHGAERDPSGDVEVTHGPPVPQSAAGTGPAAPEPFADPISRGRPSGSNR